MSRLCIKRLKTIKIKCSCLHIVSNGLLPVDIIIFDVLMMVIRSWTLNVKEDANVMTMEMQNYDSKNPERDDNSCVQVGVFVISIQSCLNNDPFDLRAKSPHCLIKNSIMK